MGANAFIIKLLLCHHPESDAASCELGVRVLASSHEEVTRSPLAKVHTPGPLSVTEVALYKLLNAPSLNHLPQADAKNHGKT